MLLPKQSSKQGRARAVDYLVHALGGGADRYFTPKTCSKCFIQKTFSSFEHTVYLGAPGPIGTTPLDFKQVQTFATNVRGRYLENNKRKTALSATISRTLE